MKTASGQHRPKEERLPQGKEWLLFYHNTLQEIGDHNLIDAAFTQLPQDAFFTSTNNTIPEDGTPQKSTNANAISSSSRKNSGKSREAANIAIEKKNIEIAKIARFEHCNKQNDRLEMLEKKIFEHEEELESAKKDRSKKRKRKFLRSTLKRLKSN